MTLTSHWHCRADAAVLPRLYRVGRTARAGRSGWSLSLITQYDVELVHQIEGLIGHQLQVGASRAAG